MRVCQAECHSLVELTGRTFYLLIQSAVSALTVYSIHVWVHKHSPRFDWKKWGVDGYLFWSYGCLALSWYRVSRGWILQNLVIFQSTRATIKVDSFGLYWKISVTTGWIAMTFCTDTHGPQRLNPHGVGNTLKFYLEPFSELSKFKLAEYFDLWPNISKIKILDQPQLYFAFTVN